MKKYWWTITIIIAVIVLAYFLISNNNSSGVDEKTAKCIGENSVLYAQLGCHACGIQKEMFGQNIEFLNTIDCWYEKEKCEGITTIPTWEIKGEKIIGVQSIEKLKELTGC